MNPNRIRFINNKYNDHSKKYVVYWMQQSIRTNYNHALDYAVNISNLIDLPLLVVFVLRDNYLGANKRHYHFMLEGLLEAQDELKKEGITFTILDEDSFFHILNDAYTLVMDYGYLKDQINWRKKAYEYIINNEINTNVVMIESDVVVPVKHAYFKSAYGAYVIRPHLMKKYKDYLDYDGKLVYNVKKEVTISKKYLIEVNFDILNKLNIDNSVLPYPLFKGGNKEAVIHLKKFLEEKINNYSNRSDPSLSIQSYQSIYLHYGNISPLEILDITNQYLYDGYINKVDYDSFIEQLLVRRELSFNFVTYQKDYDDFYSMTESWAYLTMEEHLSDKREYIYSKNEIEFGLTHDQYFNACMKEARITGFMANYMRMYWAKKIIEWSLTYLDAYYLTVYLNNKYLLDGRDANTYTNIAWCYGKMDRPWINRNVFGKLRYMNSTGLERKFNMKKYLEMINDLDYNKN